MCKKWICRLNVSFSLSSDRIAGSDRLKRLFADPANPTDAEIARYFERVVDDVAGSNDGSELLANAKRRIECVAVD